MTPITVVIAERRHANRAACRRVLERETGIRVVAEARSGLQVLASSKLNARVLLLGMDLSPGNSVVLLRILRQQTRRTKVILLTDAVPESAILDALAHGARGYLARRALPVFLTKAVRAVNAGQAWVPRKMVTKIIARLARLTAATTRD
jgi:DNA-binding NarL/FixJ family response regulator